MTRRAPRGQNLVLLALTMLFLALMVTMTIGLGLRIRQKHELQNLADTAAFSNAVMTARTFNNMAAINRLEVSYWVAQSADQSLISWTGYARGLANGAHKAATEILISPCGRRNPVPRRDVITFRNSVRAFVNAEIDVDDWEKMDGLAGKESLGIQGTIVDLRTTLSGSTINPNPLSLRDKFYRQITTQQLTQQIVLLSKQSDISVVLTGRGATPNSPASVSMREVDCDASGTGAGELTGDAPGGSGLCLRSTWSENQLLAAMGSRGNSFTTGRSQLPPKITTALSSFATGTVSISFGGKQGSAYWANRKTHGTSPTGTEAWGDDDGSVTVRAGPCSYTQPIVAHVRSTHEIDQNDQHMYSPATLARSSELDLTSPDEVKPEFNHTMGDCTPLCPSVWVRTIGFQPTDSEADAWGQPKTLVALQRDLTMKTFPWELHFKFPFSATGPASEWDGRGRQLHTRAGNGLNIANQGAVATGIAYYHRRDHWDEFPNLLNPFWRATLAPIDVDDSPRDANRALSAPEFKFQRDAYTALRNVGYQGLH